MSIISNPVASQENIEAMNASLITLQSGLKVFQTSGHGAKFSDGTIFEPTPEQCEKIKEFWGFLQVDRIFRKVETDLPGIKVSTSDQRIPEDTLNMMRALQEHFSDCLFLVSFMAVSALREMGIRDEFPHWLGANATKETSRSKPDEKIWDVNNFAY